MVAGNDNAVDTRKHPDVFTPEEAVAYLRLDSVEVLDQRKFPMATVIEPIRMNLRNAAKFLDVSERKLQRLVAAGKIRYTTDPGGLRMYPTSELRKFQKGLEAEQWGLTQHE